MVSKDKSFYLDDIEDTKVKTSKKSFLKRTIVLALSFLTLLLGVGVIPMATSNQSDNTEASALFNWISCDAIKNGSPSSAPDPKDLVGYNDNVTRTLSVFEAFGSSLAWTSYTGEGEPGIFFAGAYGMTGPDGNDSYDFHGGSRAKEAYSDMGIESSFPEDKKQELLNIAPDFSSCFLNGITRGIGNGLLNFAKLESWFAGFVASTVFNPKLICEDASQSHCVNLVGVIGGKNDKAGEGIIGSLTNSIYIPLVILTFIVVAMWILWKGIVKRQFRDAIFGAAWALIAFILGYAFLQHPSMLSKGPITVANTINGCILDAISGGNCVGNPSTTGPVNENANPCYNGADVEDNLNVKTQLNVDALACSVWKAFVLEPWSQGQFGMSYEDLTIGQSSSENFNNAISSSELNRSSFAINMKPNSSINGLRSDELVLDSTQNSISNLGVYQLYLMTQATDNSTSYGNAAGQPLKLDDGTDARWYKIISVTAHDDGIWDSWVGDGGTLLNRITLAFVSIVAATIGMILIVVLSLIALLYLVAAIFLMAFAPIFFLIGIHPGRGRDILKGYAEMVFSNIIKFLASELFLVVALALYGAVLGNADSMWISLIFVIVLSMALFMYRKEFIEMLGKVDMGGKQMSNKMGDWIGKKVKRGGEFAKVTAGAAIGGAIATGSPIGGTWQGLKDGAKRDLKRGQGFVAGAMRSGEQVKNQYVKEIDKKKLDNKDEIASQQAAVQDSKANLEKAEENIDKNNLETDEQRLKVSLALDDMSESEGRTVKNIEGLTLDSMANAGFGNDQHADYASFALLFNQAEQAREFLNTPGLDGERYDKALERYENLRNRYDGFSARMTDEEFSAGQNALREQMIAKGISDEDLVYLDSNLNLQERDRYGLHLQGEYADAASDFYSKEFELKKAQVEGKYLTKKSEKLHSGTVQAMVEKQQQKKSEKLAKKVEKSSTKELDKAREEMTKEERRKEDLRSKIAESFAKQEEIDRKKKQSAEKDQHEYESVMNARAERLRKEGSSETQIQMDRRTHDKNREDALKAKEESERKLTPSEKIAKEREDRVSKERERQARADEKIAKENERSAKAIEEMSQKFAQSLESRRAELKAKSQTLIDDYSKERDIIEAQYREDGKSEEFITEDRRISDRAHERELSELNRAGNIEIEKERASQNKKLQSAEKKRRERHADSVAKENAKRAEIQAKEHERLVRREASTNEAKFDAARRRSLETSDAYETLLEREQYRRK